jgi:peptidoglycan/xylan/chitin deacetylase (PgdA/CDA1 family)
MLRIILFIVVNGLSGAVQALAASHGVILQYHHVATDTPAITSVTPALFRQQMTFLRDNGFAVWPLPRLVEHLQADKPVPDGVVVITFDDAYRNIHDNAAPILREFGFPFTVFVSTEFVANRQRGYMTWDDLSALQKLGGTLANHTHRHPHLLRRLEGESESAWKARIQSEITTAEQLLQAHVGDHPRYLAYPYGEANEAVIAMVQQLGYIGFGQQSGAVDKAALASGMAPRFPFNMHYADMTEFQHKASSVPLPVLQLESSPMLWEKAGVPLLRLQLAEQVQQLSCFASGQGAIKVIRQNDNWFEVRANGPIPVGRSRYNCTAALPAADSGLALKPRFYWLSRQWIRKRDDGSWYPEP